MKKLSEMKFIKPNLKKVEAKMNEIIHDLKKRNHPMSKMLY